MRHILILFLFAGSLAAQCDCNNPPAADSTYFETEREFIAGNTHTRLYMKMVQEDSVQYLQGEIYQSSGGGNFFNVYQGQEMKVVFRDSSYLVIIVTKLIQNNTGQHATENTQSTYFTIAVPEYGIDKLSIKDIKEIIIDNKKGLNQKTPEILNTYKKFKSSVVIRKWICCLQDKSRTH